MWELREDVKARTCMYRCTRIQVNVDTHRGWPTHNNCFCFWSTVTGTWTHVVWTMARHSAQAITATHRVFVDKVLKVTMNTLFFPLKSTSVNYIGKSHWASSPLFVGNIDSLMFCPWVLSPSDVVTIYESTGVTVILSEISETLYSSLPLSFVIVFHSHIIYTTAFT